MTDPDSLFSNDLRVLYDASADIIEAADDRGWVD